MQEAYIQEKNAVGDWVKIGYSAPGTKGDDNYSYASKVIDYGSAENAATWTATPTTGVTLNDCAHGESWKLKADLDNTSNLAIEDDESAGDCTVLTASWDNLTHGTIATAGGAEAGAGEGAGAGENP